MSTAASLVLYIGDDTAFFRVLTGEMKRLQGSLPLKYEQLFEKNPANIQTLIPRILAKNPALIFVDLSKHSEEYAHVASILVRTNHHRPCPVIGLHDYLSPPEQIKESVLAGVVINHVKSAEVFDPAYGAVSLLSGDPKQHGFAVADLEETIIITHLCKVGFVDSQSLHFETNLEFHEGAELRLRHAFDKTIPSTLVKVRGVSPSLLFYHFRRAVDADFCWVDPLVIPEGTEHARVQELKGEYDHHVVKARKGLKAWLADNADRSLNKPVRVLVVDRSLCFYRRPERADRHGYALRCQPFLKDPVAELDAQRPLVIAFALDGADVKGKVEGPANDIAALQAIAGTLRQHHGGRPYLVVFNAASASSKQLQQDLSYPNAMAYDGDISVEVMLKLAELFSKKLKVEQLAPRDPATVFLKKSSPLSIAELEAEVVLTKLSETDAVFNSATALPPGTVVRFEKPFQGYLTVAVNPQLKAPAHYGLINGLGEEEKKALRRHINGLFFTDLDAGKLEELSAFKELNDAKMQERAAIEEAARAEAAAAAAAAAQEAASAAPAPTGDDATKKPA